MPPRWPAREMPGTENEKIRLITRTVMIEDVSRLSRLSTTKSAAKSP
jgi:hypothetical protein